MSVLNQLAQVQQSWQSPALLNNWTNYGNGSNPAGYWKDSLGVVHLRGYVRNGTGVIFTLPTGYRPANNEFFNAMTYNLTLNVQATGFVVVGSDGGVTAYNGSNAFMLDGLTFRAT